MIADLVSKLIAAGTPPDVAAVVVAEAFASGVAVGVRGHPQNSADTSADRRREKDRLRKQNVRGIPQNSADSAEIPQTQENASISKDLKKRERQNNRGTRISADWALTDAERSFAKQEGFSDWEIQRETQKFRDYWTAAAGSKGVKRDWPATWRQWIRSGADRAGKTPAPNSGNASAVDAPGFYAKAESEQLAAWDAFTQRTTGKLLPRDRNFGWRVSAEWPPDYTPSSHAGDLMSAPLLRSLQQ